MPDSSSIRTCQSCGVELPPELPEKICPACLIGGAASFISNSPGPVAVAGFDPPKPEELALIFPEYEIRSFLGRGGMGVVYHAYQSDLEREVAVKILPPETAAEPEFRERFRREAATLAQLDHPHIVKLYDFGEREGFFFFVMEYVEGADLAVQMASDRFTTAEILGMVGQICDALDYSHERGVIHRDIKPANILIDIEGCAKLVDFGLAKVIVGDEVDPGLTLTRSTMGTPQYMAPEQLTADQVADHRADIYAVGVLLYELFTGKIPVGKFANPSEENETINQGFDRVILKSLNHEPEERYQRVSEIQSGLDDASRFRKKPFLKYAIAALVIGGFACWWMPRDSASSIPGTLVEQEVLEFDYSSSELNPDPASQGWLPNNVKLGDGGNSRFVKVDGRPAWRIDDHLLSSQFDHPNYSLSFPKAKESFQKFYDDGWEFTFTYRIAEQSPLSDYTAFCGWSIPGHLAPEGWEIPPGSRARVGFYLGRKYRNRLLSKEVESIFVSRDIVKLPLEKFGRRGSAFSRAVEEAGSWHTVQVLGEARSYRYEWFVDGVFAGAGRLSDELLEGEGAGITFQSGSPKAIGRASDWSHISLKSR